MKYLIAGVSFTLSVFLSLLAAYCIYLGITDTWTWYIVGIGIAATDLVVLLIFTVAVSAVKEY